MEQNPYQPPTSRTPGTDSPGPSSFSAGGSPEAERPVGEVAKEQVHRATSLVKDRATSLAEERKLQAATEVDRVVGALRQTGDALRRSEADGMGRLVSRAADGLDRVGGYIHSHDVNGMLRDVQTLGRRHPLALVGGALLVGIVLGRVLRASSHEDEVDVVFEPEPNLLEDRPASPPLSGGLA